MADFITVDQYTAVKLEDGGQYGWKLVEGWVGRDGDFKPNFCDREYKKGSGKKTAPVTVKLGTKEQAIAALQGLLASLTTTNDVPF